VSDDPHILSTVILTAHWLIVIGLSLRVIARRLPVGISLAWLAVIFAVPFAGAAAYLVFGGKRLSAERVMRHVAAQRAVGSVLATLREEPNSASPAAGSTGETLYWQTLGVMGVPALDGNRAILLHDYGSVFDALVEDIDEATDTCQLAFYIWHEGGRADDVAAALERARLRDVRCRVLVDAVGSKEFLEGTRVRALRAAGVEVVGVLPPSFRSRADLRYHRKIVVVDEHVGYAGSQNLVDPRFFKQKSGVGRWVDAMARLEGPAVALLATIFETDWSVETGSAFEPATSWPPAADAGSPDRALVQVVPSGPMPYPDAIRKLVLTAIYSARQTLTLTTPYFVPDDAVLTALCSAAQGGVTVTLIVPARNDSRLVRYAGVASFEDLMATGVRIALFQEGLLHTKSMVVDGTVSLFGSVNLDMRSFWLNFENSLFVYGSEFASRISDLQQEYLTHCVFVDPDDWRGRPAHHRFAEDAARLVGPLL